MKDTPFEIERTFNAPVEKVWEAITDKEKMKEWYFSLEEFEPEVGFEFEFYGGTEEKQYLHVCKVLEVKENKKLKYSWRYEGYPGESFLTFELSTDDNGTKLKLAHEGLDSFPADKDPNFSKKSFSEGWNYIIGTSLPKYLARLKE